MGRVLLPSSGSSAVARDPEMVPPEVAKHTVQRLQNLRYLALPVVFTVGIMGLSLNRMGVASAFACRSVFSCRGVGGVLESCRSLSVRDNLPLLWGKTWIAPLSFRDNMSKGIRGCQVSGQ